jgi:hypothetical protein
MLPGLKIELVYSIRLGFLSLDFLREFLRRTATSCAKLFERTRRCYHFRDPINILCFVKKRLL